MIAVEVVAVDSKAALETYIKQFKKHKAKPEAGTLYILWDFKVSPEVDNHSGFGF